MKKNKMQNRRQGIIEAARKVFYDNGYEMTSVDMIAEKVGVAKGTIYLYFRSKQKLFLAVGMEIIEKFDKVVEEAVKKKGKNSHDKLKYLVNSTLRFVETNEKYFSIWEKQFQTLHKAFTKAQFKNINEKRIKLAGLFSAAIKEGIDSGLIRKINPEVAGIVLFTMITTFSRLDLVSIEENAIAKKTSEIMDIFLKGVGK